MNSTECLVALLQLSWSEQQYNIAAFPVLMGELQMA